MVNDRIGKDIPNNTSFPYGEDKCMILEGFVTDGTAKAGQGVQLDTTDPEKLVQTGDGDSAFLGILVFNPRWVDSNDATITFTGTPKAGQEARVCIRGPCVASINCTTDDFMGGMGLQCAGSGLLDEVAAAAHKVATLIDKRAKNSAGGALHIVYVDGVLYNAES